MDADQVLTKDGTVGAANAQPRRHPNMNAAIYVRYSSDNQRETSLADQERLCRQEADRLGYQVARVYKDAALSGQLSEQRPGFVSLMAAAKRREFDVVIVDDASRLSRDSADALRLLQRLEF